MKIHEPREDSGARFADRNAARKRRKVCPRSKKALRSRGEPFSAISETCRLFQIKGAQRVLG